MINYEEKWRELKKLIEDCLEANKFALHMSVHEYKQKEAIISLCLNMLKQMDEMDETNMCSNPK